MQKNCVEDKEGYIDLSAIGGYSGSPIFLNTTPPKFLGVLVSGTADSSSEGSCVSMYVPGYMILDFAKEKQKKGVAEIRYAQHYVYKLMAKFIPYL